MAASEADGKVEVTVLQARYLATLGRYRTDDKFCVKLWLGDQAFETKMQTRDRFRTGTSVSWKTSFKFTFVGPMPDLTLEVFAEESDRKDISIGRAIVSYTDLSSNGEPSIGTSNKHTFLLSGDTGRPSSKSQSPTLAVSIRFISLGDLEPIDDLSISDALKEADDAVENASKALNQMQRLKIPGFSVGQGTANSEVAGPAAAIGSILKTIGTIADIMDELTDIHPYAKAAWSILDLTRKVIKAQMKEDDSIRDLYEQMGSLRKRIGTFVERLNTISPSNTNQDEETILGNVASTCRDCSKFIISFCDRNFANRAMKCALFGDASKTIENFRAKFAALKTSFDEKVWDGTALVARQILENQKTGQVVLDRVDTNAQYMLEVQTAGEVAEFMVHSASLLASSHQSCHPDTQITIRKTITEWIDSIDEDVPRVLLLSGMAGTGKSTIAHTIATEYEERQGKYCTSFAFNRRGQPPPAAGKLLPHIAAFLATLYPAVRKALAEKKAIASGVDLERQLRELILEPLKQPRPNAPSRIVVLVDAIDESDSDGVQAAKLASLLVTACDELPSNIRIFVTSRVETYVVKTMWPSPVQRLDMPDSSDESLAEVRLFIQAQLQGLPDIDEFHYDNLMTTSQGLFQWAATACKEIIGTPLLGGSTPLKRYNMVVASGLRRDKSGLLDSLYEDVLKRAFNDAESTHLLGKVIAALFAMMEPMTLDAFRELYAQLGLGDASDVDCTLPYLPSILDGISDRTRNVQPNHTSLRDFFLDPHRSGSFCVKDLMPGTHDRAARGSFSIMSTALPQVACTLDFARLWVKGEGFNHGYVVAEAGRVQGDMPRDVQYTTLYGVKHLAEAPAPEEAFWTKLATSLLTDDHALHWIELFCLLAAHKLGKTERTSPELSGCMLLLAHIAKRPGSSCSPRIQSAAEFASTILFAGSDASFTFNLGYTLDRLGQIYESVAWTVTLQHQPEDGPLVTIGTGFFVRLDGAPHDVVLTTAHNLRDTNECPRKDLVINIPTQVPRLAGALQFSDVQFSVPPEDVYVCADFSQRRQLETDWAAIRLPRGTALGDGFLFDLALKDPDTVAQGLYGQLSWIDRHLHLPVSDSNVCADVTHPAVLDDPVANGAPISAFGAGYSTPVVRGIRNCIYGNNAYTKLTPALTCELGSWLGLGKSNIRLRWLSDLPACHDLYLYVNEGANAGEDSRLYLKHGSGSSFDISIASSNTRSVLLRFGSRLVDVLYEDNKGTNNEDTEDSDDRDTNDEHTDRGDWLACVSASDHKGGRGLGVWMKQHADEDKQTSRETITLTHKFWFYVESTPIAGSSPGDSELIKISLRPGKGKAKQGETEHHYLQFALEY